MLLEQSLRGTIAVGVVWAVNRRLAGRMRADARRGLWLLAAAVFLVPWKIALPSAAAARYFDALPAMINLPLTMSADTAAQPARAVDAPLLVTVWWSGMAVWVGWLATQTLMVSRRWSRERLCTDALLLGLLEDAKRIGGVTAPIGLVVAERVPTPALMGWLRPRILLPAALAGSLTERQLTMIFLHELAHFRRLDIPAGWLLAMVQAVHWFNPFAWLMVSGWRKFREEAADETALAWLGDADGEAYGETLLEVLRFASGGHAAIPFGSLAIGESMQNLKMRMMMIKNYRKKTVCYGWLAVLAAALTVTALVAPARAESEQDKVVKSVTAWVKIIDDGKYAESWQAGSAWFKKQVPEQQWGKLLAATRPALGKNLRREVNSVMPMKQLPVKPDGSELRDGEFLVVIFSSSFENMKDATEVVTFEKVADGGWKADGYYIKPK